MSYKPILIVGGEPNSIFLEIYFKILKTKKITSPLVLITSEKLLRVHMKKLKFKKKIRFLNDTNIEKYNLDNQSINLIDVEYKHYKNLGKISKKSNSFIEKSFQIAFKILKQNKIKRFINGPISKKYFLNHKFLGITEYISKNFSEKKNLYVNL